MGKSSENTSQLLHGKPMNAVCASDAVFQAIERHYKPLRHGLEYLARDAEVEPRTARNWWDRICNPQFKHVAALMAHNDAFAQDMFLAVAQMKIARSQQRIEATRAQNQRVREMLNGNNSAMDSGAVHCHE